MSQNGVSCQFFNFFFNFFLVSHFPHFFSFFLCFVSSLSSRFALYARYCRSCRRIKFTPCLPPPPTRRSAAGKIGAEPTEKEAEFAMRPWGQATSVAADELAQQQPRWPPQPANWPIGAPEIPPMPHGWAVTLQGLSEAKVWAVEN